MQCVNHLGNQDAQVRVKSKPGRKAFAEWLTDNDQETLDMLKVIKSGFGHIDEITYQHNEDLKQQGLVSHMKAAKERIAQEAIEKSKQALR